MSQKMSNEAHAMWAKVVMVLGVGVIGALAHAKPDDVIGVMLIVGALLFFLY